MHTLRRRAELLQLWTSKTLNLTTCISRPSPAQTTLQVGRAFSPLSLNLASSSRIYAAALWSGEHFICPYTAASTVSFASSPMFCYHTDFLQVLTFSRLLPSRKKLKCRSKLRLLAFFAFPHLSIFRNVCSFLQAVKSHETHPLAVIPPYVCFLVSHWSRSRTIHI